MALTLQKVKKAAGEYDPELITRVRLPSASLTAMGGLETVVNMIELALPNNAIRAISGLEACVKLERIDLSSNQISRIEGLEGLTSLRFLDLRENQIRELGNIDALVNLHCLEQLHLQNGADGTRRNAVCEEATYLSTIKTRLPALTTLDNERMALKMDAGEADGLQADAELLEPLPAESWCQGGWVWSQQTRGPQLWLVAAEASLPSCRPAPSPLAISSLPQPRPLLRTSDLPRCHSGGLGPALSTGRCGGSNE
mmetsp:Transcript_11141/g.29845  ORF Transcript_11141/g.29845 Transcript_11141/m.29845 type:complete len:255 (-) Transcript_11141:555-1319(-)